MRKISRQRDTRGVGLGEAELINRGEEILIRARMINESLERQIRGAVPQDSAHHREGGRLPDTRHR
jgi:hypothetical protein